MSKNIIEIQGVSKVYGDNTVLDNLSLNIRENEFLTLLGPSGCGKTTTLKIIAGFELQGIGTILCIIIYYNKKARCISQGTVPFTPEKNRYTLWYENRSIEDYRLIIFV